MPRSEVHPENYTDVETQQFITDMQRAGVGEVVYHYKGRFFWEGPAVDVRDLQDALSATQVKCQWDQMGLGFVVHPRKSSKYHEESQPILVKDEDDELDACENEPKWPEELKDSDDDDDWNRDEE